LLVPGSGLLFFVVLAIDLELELTKFWNSSAFGLIRGLIIAFMNIPLLFST
jgi:hypothetical protein